MFSLLLVFFSYILLPHQASSEKLPGKKWSTSLNHSFSRGAEFASKGSWSNGMNVSYKWKSYSFSANGSYIQPYGKVSDDTYYGLTDISISGSMAVKFLKPFLGLDTQGTLGVSLPTSENSLKAGKYASVYTSINYGKKVFRIFQLSLSHVIYSGLYRYRSNRAGSSSNNLASSSHTATLSLTKKQLTLSVSGRLYAYLYLADMNPDIDIEDIQTRFNGSQGASMQLAYKHVLKSPKPISVQGFLRASLNVPVVSPVLTGFGFTYRNWQYSAGLSWGI